MHPAAGDVCSTHPRHVDPLVLLPSSWSCLSQVRHPGVSDAIERDFQTMVWVAHVATQLLPSVRSLRLEDTLKQFAAPLHEQVRAAACWVFVGGAGAATL